MSLARWDPLRQFQHLENEMNRLFRQQLSGASRSEDALTASQFAPPLASNAKHVRVFARKRDAC
jgi:hypothetical protein